MAEAMWARSPEKGIGSQRPELMMEAQPIRSVTQRMESSDGVLWVVGVDVEEAALRTHGDVSVVSQGLYRGAERLGRLVVRGGVGATA